MKRADLSHLNNGLGDALTVVGPWWALLVVWAVSEGHTRFEPLQRELGIARNILSTRLNDLVSAEVLEKRPYSHRPLRHEYLLTESGQALVPVIGSLESWGRTWVRPGA